MAAGPTGIQDWWKRKTAPQMVGAKSSNPMYTYTPTTQTTRPDQFQADPYMMPEKVAAMEKRRLAGEFDTETEMWEKELDREWLSEAFQSAIPGAPNLPTPPSAPSGAGQPSPGDFETLFSMGDPLKRKRLEEIGRTA